MKKSNKKDINFDKVKMKRHFSLNFKTLSVFVSAYEI